MSALLRIICVGTRSLCLADTAGFHSAGVRCLSSLQTYKTPSFASRSNHLTSEFGHQKPLDRLPNISSITPEQTPFATQLNGLKMDFEYRLPTVWYNNTLKKSIVDPLTGLLAYDLPTLYGNREVKELPVTSNTPVADPQTSPVVDVIMQPYLITIRHRKMKKHQRRKLRKRMKFVMRRRKQEKQRRRERQIKAYEMKMAKQAAEYDAEKYIEKQLELARSAGWGIDVIAEFAKKQVTASSHGSNVSK